jgi:hypothetical protein
VTTTSRQPSITVRSLTLLKPCNAATRPLTEILASGGDSRQVIDPQTGTSKYGCAYAPDPHIVEFGSCTASTISPTAYAAAERVIGWIRAIDEPYLSDAVDDLHETVRHQLRSLLLDSRTPSIDVALTPSGTDAELIALDLFASRSDAPVVNIVVGPAEVGSGTTLAAAGRHFDSQVPNGQLVDPGTPVDTRLAARTTVKRVGMRADAGGERSDIDIDTEICALAVDALHDGARVLIHVVAHSKTGVHAPSLDAVDDLILRFGDRVGVVIDAAQGRFSRRGLSESLRSDRMVIITGSKFFGGPPFAGSLLVPPAWQPLAHHRPPHGFDQYFSSSQMPRNWAGARSALPSSQNLGLLLRWHAALGDMNSYYAVPSRLRLEVLRAFESMVPEIWSRSDRLRINAVSPPLIENDTHRLLESKTTVFPFSVSCGDRDLSYGELGQVYRWMRDDVGGLLPEASPTQRAVLSTPIQIGQPVRLGLDQHGVAVLRVAISGTRITSACVGMEGGTSFEDRLRTLSHDLEATLAKLDLIASNFDTLADRAFAA